MPNMPVRDLAEDNKRITNGTDLERTGLLLFAAVAFLAGLVLVGQAHHSSRVRDRRSAARRCTPWG